MCQCFYSACLPCVLQLEMCDFELNHLLVYTSVILTPQSVWTFVFCLCALVCWCGCECMSQCLLAFILHRYLCSGVFAQDSDFSSQAEWREASGFSLSLGVAVFFFFFLPPSLFQHVNHHEPTPTCVCLLFFFLLVQEQILMCVCVCLCMQIYLDIKTQIQCLLSC